MDSFTLDKIEFDAVRRVLAQFCSCSLGKHRAMRIGPSRSPEIVQQWLMQTSQMVEAVREVGIPPMGGVKDITEQIARAHPGGGASGEDFADIAATLEGAAVVREYFNRLGEKFDLLHEIAGEIASFDGEVEAIRQVVDSDGSIRDDASTRLAVIRREIDRLVLHIREVIYGYLRQEAVARLLQNATVTIHGDRLVLPVKAENRGRLPGVVHRASASGATVFVEPEASVEMNNRLADLHGDARQEIRRLLNELAVRIQTRTDDISKTLRVLAGADLLSAKAQYAYQFDMVCPQISERGHIMFHQARHPLLMAQAWRQEQAGVPEDKRQQVVPIDVRLGSDFDLLVITGSNTGGKTVTLKTVALLVLMAQSGMHIPAQRGATMPVFRDVFIDVGDEQSLQQSLSTFGAHIKRIRYILGKARQTSLVLLDELGAGTDPDEGGAIGQAVLDELRKIGCLGMLTTHLSVLKAYAFTHGRVDNASVEFDPKTMTPTYRLRIGTPGESHAITVAQHLGMPRRIMNDAKRHLSSQGKQFQRAIRATSVARETAEEARAEAQVAHLAAVTQQDAYQAKLADLHRLHEDFETWLASLPHLSPGDEIPIRKLGKTGRLVRMELHRQIAVVDADNMQIEVPLSDLLPDFGADDVRKEIASLREQILTQAKETEQLRAEAEHVRSEYHRSLQYQKQRARQFDDWLGVIARVKVGDVVPIAKKPGRAKVLALDLVGLRATVETDGRQFDLAIQELFPQTGPFAAPHRPAEPRKPKSQHKPPTNKPMSRRRGGASAEKARQTLLNIEPGAQVFVVPFNKRATLIRIDQAKEHAVVQSGIFEIDIPLKDLEPIEVKPNK